MELPAFEECGNTGAGSGDDPCFDAGAPQPLTRMQLGRLIRNHIDCQLYDDSRSARSGTAIYTLADPRDITLVRYVGQTSSPRRRFLQHLNTARLWLPLAQAPWWVVSPKLRPLYGWIRTLHGEEFRLPTMVVYEWHATQAQARIAERRWIFECLERRLPILNFEAQQHRRQLPLI